MAKAKDKVAKPSDYTPEVGDIICERISRMEALAKICDTDDSLPSARTVYRWLRENEDFCQNYTRAKEDQADYLADDTLTICDDQSIDPQQKRIMVDTRKWLASKFKPKKYGDRIAVAGDSENPLTMMISEIAGKTLGPVSDDT